jgi:hypothetical protein
MVVWPDEHRALRCLMSRGRLPGSIPDFNHMLYPVGAWNCEMVADHEMV